MNPAADQVMDLIFGRWRSQILSAGTELGVFDHLDKRTARTAETLAAELGADPTLLYRLLRAQAAIGLLEEDGARGFALTDKGEHLRSDHPQSLKPMARLEEGPQHYALWKHLPAMVRDGKQNAFVREFGCMAFKYAQENQDYAERFKQAMTSYSAIQSSLVLEALRGYDLSPVAPSAMSPAAMDTSCALCSWPIQAFAGSSSTSPRSLMTSMSCGRGSWDSSNDANTWPATCSKPCPRRTPTASR
jgi:hypothetical protein